MAAKKRRKSAKKRTHKKGGKRKTHKRGGKMPLKVLEHMVFNAEQALKRRGGKPQRHTKAALKAARKRK